MKTITRFVNALQAQFQGTNIGAYFAPLFRPMITGQGRLHPIRVRPDSAHPLLIALSRSRSSAEQSNRS